MRIASSIMLLMGVGCVGDDAFETGWSEREVLIDGDPPPLPWNRVSGNPNVKATYVVSAGDLQEYAGNNVIIGYIDLYTNTYSFGSNSGAMAVFHYWQRTRGVYPDSTCTGSSPYDHAPINVDTGCPGVPTGGHNHWSACPVHVMEGWGSAAPNRLFGIWSASATEVHFSWNVGDVKKKDYWFVRKKLSRIHYLELDGARSNGPDSYSPSERTHGFAVGSNLQFNTSASLSTAMATHSFTTVHERDYVWDNGEVSVRNGTAATYNACNGRTNELWWSFHCEDNLCGGDHHPHTVECISKTTDDATFSENLRYLADPWPATNNRKNAFWEWHACHVPSGSCYHAGSHAYPLLQAIDDLGAFYGWVGIEHQKDDANPDHDDMQVVRWLRTELLP